MSGGALAPQTSEACAGTSSPIFLVPQLVIRFLMRTGHAILLFGGSCFAPIPRKIGEGTAPSHSPSGAFLGPNFQHGQDLVAGIRGKHTSPGLKLDGPNIATLAHFAQQAQGPIFTTTGDGSQGPPLAAKG